MNVNGNVAQITSRMVNTRFGEKPVYQMEVDGNWIDLGFGKPKYTEGEHVNLEVTKNKYGKFEIVGGAAPNGAAASKPAHKTNNTRESAGFPVPTNNYQTGIIRQNALTNAVNCLNHLDISHESKEELIETIIDIAYEFADFSSGQREIKRAKQLMGDKIGTVNEDD